MFVNVKVFSIIVSDLREFCISKVRLRDIACLHDIVLIITSTFVGLAMETLIETS